MDIILKKAVKDFKQLGWRSWLIVLTIILSIGGGLGLYYGMSAAIPMMDAYFDEANHADYTYQLNENTWLNQTQLDGLEDVNEVEDYTGRLFWQASLKLPDQKDRKYLLLVGLDPDIEWPKVYNYTLREGKKFNNNGDNKSAVIDQIFAKTNEIEIGDKIEIDGLNNAEIKISGTCNAPEFIMTTSNPEYLFPIEGSMGVIFLSKNTLRNYIVQYFIWYNSTVLEDLTPIIYYYQTVDYNNIAVTFKNNVKISEGNEAVKEYLEDTCNADIEKAEYFEDFYAYRLMKADVSDTSEIMMILMIFMALMAGIIVYVIFNRYVYSQKQQVGILLGLGYTKKDILKYFLFNVLVIAIISIPIGIILGYFLGFIFISQMMAELVNLNIFEFPFIFLPEVTYLGIILGSSIIFFSTFFTIRKINRQVIAELIYEQTEVAHKIKKPKESKKPRNVTNKLVAHNFFRNKKRMAFTITAMTFSLLIVSATQSLLDTMYYNVNKTFKNPASNIESNEKWDLNVLFQTNPNISNPNCIVNDIEDIDDVQTIEIYTKGLITAKGDEDQNLILQGINIANNDVHSFTWKDPDADNSAPEKDDEIAISSVHALKLGKRLGDKLTIENAKNEKFEFTIVGIHHELVMTPYVTLDAGQEIFHNSSNLIDGVYVILENDADRDKVIDDIYDMGNIEVIFDIEDMNEKAMEFIDNYSVVLTVIVFYTFIVSFFIVLYNSIMNIYDKNYEYGILRSLGYEKRSTFKMILTENFIQGLFPIIFALIFTYPLTLEMAQVYEEEFPLVTIFGLTALFMITIPPLILYVLGSFFGLRTVYRQNLYEQVQTRFVG